MFSFIPPIMFIQNLAKSAAGESLPPCYSPALSSLIHCFIWQRSGEYIYPAKEIIFLCYYNRNEAETVVADQLKQASSITISFLDL